jgi:hypothetical protein
VKNIKVLRGVFYAILMNSFGTPILSIFKMLKTVIESLGSFAIVAVILTNVDGFGL